MQAFMVPLQSTLKLTTFLDKLKTLVDKRDNRGKRHKLAFVLAASIIAIMSGRAKMSSIHRFIKNKISWLCRITGFHQATVISRAQLPRILATIDWKALNIIIENHFGVVIERKGKEWYALDGKTLRGTAGKKERVLIAIEHNSQEVVAQEPMQGPKQSEIKAVREMLEATGLEEENVTVDALHLVPDTTSQVNLAGGQFVIQCKENQPTLLAQLIQVAAQADALGTKTTCEKTRGRIETRTATFFSVSQVDFAPRWADSDFETLVVMQRQTIYLNQNKTTSEISYYLSNAVVEQGDVEIQSELFWVIRRHWRVENHNQVRDVTFKEDQVRVKDPNQAQVMASLRTVAISVFRQADVDNFQAMLEKFNDCPHFFVAFLKRIKFL